MGNSRRLRRIVHILPGVLQERSQYRKRQRLGYGLPRGRQQLLGSTGGADPCACEVRARTAARSRGRTLADPVLFRCPIVFIEDTGGAEFSNEEVDRLREYLLKGGFLWMDDSWGSANWNRWISQIARVLPPGEFPVVDIPPTHQIMHVLYSVKEIPQVPSMNYWYRSGGRTSENGPDSASVFFKGIQDSRGHLMVVMTHNTDIADSWEREGDSTEFFDLFSPRGYALGMNIVLYALTH